MPKFLWTEKQAFGPAARAGHMMGYDSKRGRVALFGGTVAKKVNKTDVSTFFGDTWEWDGISWTQVSDVGPTPRVGAAMAFDYARQRLILFGGRDEAQKPHRDTWEWDGEDWTQLSDEGPNPNSVSAMVG